MALFLYPAQLAVDFDTMMPVAAARDAVGQIVQRGNPAVVPTIYEDQAGTVVIPSASRSATAQGVVAPFYIDESFGPVSWYAGGIEYPLLSVEGVNKRLEEALVIVASALIQAQEARAAAENAATARLPAGGTTGQVLTKNSGADRDAIWATPVSGGGGGSSLTDWAQVQALAGYPGTFPPSGHTHSRSQISDASGLGRDLLAAGDAQAARALIGAGTGNGTSNLQLGSTGTTAMPGNRSFSDADITAAANGTLAAGTVRSQIAALESRAAGSGGVRTIEVLRYESGSYPAWPVSKPAGLVLYLAIGPVQPTGLPSWIGVGPGQVVCLYNGVPLT